MHITEVQIDWRLISNSGVDEGFIRPVVGACGWPMIPGSGIKGLFRRACPSEQQRLRWCGSRFGLGDLKPGILRFHGAWPADEGWKSGLLDIAHPQWEWQLGCKRGGEDHNPYAVVSLYRPRLQIGLSSTDPTVSEAEWQQIEATLRRALEQGIGGRTCVGYGTSGKLSGDLIFQCALEGQGPAATLLDGTAEFRPTMFRAAIRGMALRLFGGLCSETTALEVVGRLFGSLGHGAPSQVGLLSTSYVDDEGEPRLACKVQGNWRQPNYATTGNLYWRQVRDCAEGENEELLSELLAALHGLTMSLGGFGKGWRRPDHRIFYRDYYTKSHRPKPLIGCHWQWREVDQLPHWIHIQSVPELMQLLQKSRRIALRWLDATGRSTGAPPGWREVIDPDRMRIWTRHASGPGDPVVIRWFHNMPTKQDADPRDLKGTDLAGKVGKVGSVWNRMLPLLTSLSAASGTPSRHSGGRATARTFARPTATSATAIARATRPCARQPLPQGDVTITHWDHAYLETIVLFRDPRNPRLTASLERLLDEGAGAGFQLVGFRGR